MKARDRSSLALASLLATTVICVAVIPGLLDAADVENQGAWGFRGSGPMGAMVFGLAGALLGYKRPENPVGWLFCAVGIAFAAISAGETYAVIPLIQGSDSDLVYLVAWFSSWSWVIFLGLTAFAILLFPSGELPGPRWRARARLMAVGFVMGCLAFAVAPGPLNNVPSLVENRYALPDTAASELFVIVGTASFIAALLTAVAGTVQRYRRSRGLQRQQMKLFVVAAAAMGLSLVLAGLATEVSADIGNFLESINVLAMMSIPAAMTVAILRYRLYDIDVIINRTCLRCALRPARIDLSRSGRALPAGPFADHPGLGCGHRGVDPRRRGALPTSAGARPGVHRPPFLSPAIRRGGNAGGVLGPVARPGRSELPES